MNKIIFSIIFFLLVCDALSESFSTHNSHANANANINDNNNNNNKNKKVNNKRKDTKETTGTESLQYDTCEEMGGIHLKTGCFSTHQLAHLHPMRILSIEREKRNAKRNEDVQRDEMETEKLEESFNSVRPFVVSLDPNQFSQAFSIQTISCWL